MAKNTLYLECFSGISGDMTVAALLDLGADETVLMCALDSLNLDGYEVKIGRTHKCGIAAQDFDVILEHSHHHHSHDHSHGNNHDHSHEHTHDHEHSHGHTHGHGEHIHRNINDILKIINQSGLTDRAKAISEKIFDIIAVAEAKAHGIPVEEVHFHEVGAIDSIVDIVAVAVCIDNLNIHEVIVSDLYEGSGHVKCQHGIIPVPVPAVVNIAQDNGLSLRITDARGEMVTPTGAAIVAALKTKDSLPSSYSIKKIGIGAGKKDFPKANILRAFIIEETKKQSTDEVWVLETNLDDCSGENLGFVMDKLMDNRANDVFFTPIFMKKNRPAYKLSVLCKEDKIKEMESLIFRNTTSIGIRRYKTSRTILARETMTLNTKYGEVRVKVCSFEDEKYFYPEYEDIKDISNKTGISFKSLYDEVKMLEKEI